MNIEDHKVLFLINNYEYFSKIILHLKEDNLIESTIEIMIFYVFVNQEQKRNKHKLYNSDNDEGLIKPNTEKKKEAEEEIKLLPITFFKKYGKVKDFN